MSLDNRHTLALPYWARPGIASFAKKASGSAAAEVDDEEDDDDDDTEEDDDEEDDLAELSEDDLRAELKRTRESLSKASGSSKAKRDKIKKLNAELDEARKPKPKKAKDDDDDDAPDLDAIREEARREERRASDDRVRKAEARGALKAAGVPLARVSKAVGLLTLDDLDVDDDGEVEGLEDAIDALREDWPELFPKRTKRRQSVAGDADDGKSKRRALTASEIQAKAALGR